MKKKINLLLLLWIILGISFFSYGRYGYHLLLNSADNASKIQHTIETPIVSQKNRVERNAQAVFDEDEIKPVKPTEYADAQLKYVEVINKWGIGAIYSPSAGVKTKVLAGMSNTNLIVAVGTYQAEQKLGQGNYVVLAHNLVQGGGALHNITKMELGTIIYATDFSKVYEYKVQINKIENQANGELLNEPLVGETAKITLFRCEGALNTPDRAVVQGEFVTSYPAAEAKVNVLQGLGLTVKEKNVNQANTEKEKNTEEKTIVEKDESPQTKDTTEITNRKVIETTNFDMTDSVYNPFQTGAITVFKAIEQFGYLVGTIYLGVVALFFALGKILKK